MSQDFDYQEWITNLAVKSGDIFSADKRDNYRTYADSYNVTLKDIAKWLFVDREGNLYED